jgi:branched-chain amino acid transport system substrate-binding protein
MKFARTLIAAAVALAAAGAALADINVGVVPVAHRPRLRPGHPDAEAAGKLFPKEIAGEKVNLIVLDDASDPGKGVSNTRRLITEDKVDVILGSCLTPVAAAMAPVAAEEQDAADRRLAGRRAARPGPVAVPPAAGQRRHGPRDGGAHEEAGRQDHRLPRLHRRLRRAVAQGPDAEAEKNGMKIVAGERFARTDTSVTPQALKLTSANPDAMLVVATGSGAAMPEKAIVERGYKGKIYQTHAAATPDLVRIGGKDVEGTYVVSGPAWSPSSCPTTIRPRRRVDFVTKYEKANGAGSATSSPATPTTSPS